MHERLLVLPNCTTASATLRVRILPHSQPPTPSLARSPHTALARPTPTQQDIHPSTAAKLVPISRGLSLHRLIKQTTSPLPIAGSLCHTALRSAHRGNRLVRVRGAEAMSAAKVKSAALSVTHKCRVLLASNISDRSALPRCAPPLLATAVLTLTSLAPGFAEHLGRRLGSPPQHCHGRRQGKVRAPHCYSLDSYARVVLSVYLCE